MLREAPSAAAPQPCMPEASSVFTSTQPGCPVPATEPWLRLQMRPQHGSVTG